MRFFYFQQSIFVPVFTDVFSREKSSVLHIQKVRYLPKTCAVKYLSARRGWKQAYSFVFLPANVIANSRWKHFARVELSKYRSTVSTNELASLQRIMGRAGKQMVDYRGSISAIHSHWTKLSWQGQNMG